MCLRLEAEIEEAHVKAKEEMMQGIQMAKEMAQKELYDQRALYEDRIRALERELVQNTTTLQEKTKHLLSFHDLLFAYLAFLPLMLIFRGTWMLLISILVQHSSDPFTLYMMLVVCWQATNFRLYFGCRYWKSICIKMSPNWQNLQIEISTYSFLIVYYIASLQNQQTFFVVCKPVLSNASNAEM